MNPSSRKRPPRDRRNETVTDPVEVYCRIRPLRQDARRCIKVISEQAIQLIPSDSRPSARETQHSFRLVFDESSEQIDIFNHVALPMVKDLLLGKNGLLFCYGITSSGKTFTMLGSPTQPGLIPQTLDVLFDSILESQRSDKRQDGLLAKSFQVRPDAGNTFRILREQARLEEFASVGASRSINVKSKDLDFSNRPRTHTAFSEFDTDAVYAVFVSFVEIYGDKIKDLLPDERGERNPRDLKILKDSGGRTYIAHTNCLEVRDANEALRLFAQGQTNRREASTILNAQSSRSHAVFTIRLVQVPLDKEGYDVVYDADVVVVSQLSLVDLAGSERQKRTQNRGVELKEAGSINNFLMVLRKCLEELRTKQQGPQSNQLISYNQSTLTKLFKSYFDGEGKVRMIVCLNPGSEEFDETVHVLGFAETTQEVQIQRGREVRFDRLGFVAGRREQAEENKKRKLEEEMEQQTISRRKLSAFLKEVEHTIIFPPYKLSTADDSITLPNLATFLEDRIKRHKAMYAALKDQEIVFFERLKGLFTANQDQRRANAAMRRELLDRDQQIEELRRRCEYLSRTTNNLLSEFNLTEQERLTLVSRIGDRDYQTRTQEKRMRDQSSKVRSQARKHADEQEKEMSRRFQEQTDAMAKRYGEQSDKMNRIRQLIDGDDYTGPIAPSAPLPSSSSRTHTTHAATHTNVYREAERERTRVRDQSPATMNENRETRPFVNARYNLGACLPSKKTVNLVRENRVPMGTVLGRKTPTVTELTLRDTKQAGALTVEVQTADPKDGRVQVQLYKGDIIPTATRGRSVIFRDVETLQQTEPVDADLVRRTGNGERSLPPEVVRERCAMGQVHCSPQKSPMKPAPSVGGQ